MLRKKSSRAQGGLSLTTEVHGSLTKQSMATGRREFRIPLLSPAKILARQTTHGELQERIPLPCTQVCLLALPQAQVPPRCAAESSPVPAHTYLALPLVLQHDLGKALALLQELRAVGLPPLQLHKETPLSKEISSKQSVKSSAKSLGSRCYTHAFNRRLPKGLITCGMGQKEGEKHSSPHETSKHRQAFLANKITDSPPSPDSL